MSQANWGIVYPRKQTLVLSKQQLLWVSSSCEFSLWSWRGKRFRTCFFSAQKNINEVTR